MVEGGLDVSNRKIIKPVRMQMKPNKTTLVKFSAYAMLAVGSCMVQAQVLPNCKISGQPGVIASYSNTTPAENDPVYTLNYNPTSNSLEYDAGGSTGSSAVVGNQDSKVLQLPGFGLTFSKLDGNPGFNHGEFTNRLGTACGTLVDKTDDGSADDIDVQLGSYAGRGSVPSMLISFPVKQITAGRYWLLQVLDAWTDYDGPLNFFTPVNQGILPSISLVCAPNPTSTGASGTQQTDANGTLDVVVTQETNARVPGPCATTSIPTATFWGYAAMTLLLMFAGMSLLRKRGFGDDFNLRA